jgi:8-oxo-dGTP diphosphatase
MKKLVHVAVGVIFDSSLESLDHKEGRVLIAKRADHQHQGGLWEFPGGKVETGESVQVALQRELEEELGLQCSIDDMQPLISIPFHYSDKSVLLDVWSVFSGEMPTTSSDTEDAFVGKEGQPLLWVDQGKLGGYEFPAANKAIIDALILPKKIAISEDSLDPEIILAQVANTLRNHCHKENPDLWIQLRAPRLNQMQYTQLAMKLYGICHEAGSKLIWNCPLDWYQIAFADGLHLSRENVVKADLMGGDLLKSGLMVSQKVERPIPANQWLSIACHNLAELEVAQDLADYILVSPVNKTSTHIKATPLTWAGFNVISNQARIPCYAMGGMKAIDIDVAIKQGGQGIAGISYFTYEPQASIPDDHSSDAKSSNQESSDQESRYEREQS